MMYGLLVVTLALAVISGVNDGGVLLALAVRFPVVPLGWFIGIICAALVVGPLFLGLTVARTLQSGLFGDQGSVGAVFLVGVVVALAVVLGLNRWGLPTSLTLAIVGGLSGAAWGFGLGVSWATVGRVLLIGAIAPVVGAVAGWWVSRLAGLRLVDRQYRRAFHVLHLGAFSVQCVAYAVNDGQKMIAVAAVALGVQHGPWGLLDHDGPSWPLLLTLLVLMVVFCAGMLGSVRTVTARIGKQLAVLRPVDAVSAELVGAAVVLASSAAGAPVSMTQTVAGGVVGAAGSKGLRRVRWDSVARIVMAWFVTLPVSGVGAWVVAALLR